MTLTVIEVSDSDYYKVNDVDSSDSEVITEKGTVCDMMKERVSVKVMKEKGDSDGTHINYLTSDSDNSIISR